MSFIELVWKRQSVRKYSEKPVAKEDIEKCIEAARLAPSACNSQPWTFIVINDPELRHKVSKASIGPAYTFNKFVIRAPVFVAIVIEKPNAISQIGGNIKDREFPLIDIGIAAEHLCLQAAELGLGTCMIGWFNEEKVKTLLNIPGNKRLGLLITLGYPVDNYKQRKKIRKDMGKVCKYNSY